MPESNALEASRLTTAEVRAKLRAACAAMGSQKEWAREHGISQAYLCEVLRGLKEPGEAICKPLGLVRIVGYRESN